MKTNCSIIHVVFVCSGLNHPGGLERIITSLSSNLTIYQYKVTLLINDNNANSFYPLHEDVSTVLLPADFGMGGSKNYIQRKFNFVRDVKGMKKILLHLNADFVITTDYIYTVAAYLSGIHKIASLIYWQHGVFDAPKSRMWSFFCKRAYPKLDAIVVQNNTEKLIFRKYNTNVHVIHNFTEPADQRAPLTTKTILSIAQLENHKGIDLLLKAAQIVLKQHPEWKWKLIGRGSLKAEVQQKILHNNWVGRLIFQIPESHELTNEYLHASIYVMTSRREVFGMALIEAMSHGVPCIAFDCETGPRHIITHNVDGFLVEKENPEKLAEAIKILMNDEQKRKQFGASAKENVRRFSSEVIMKKWEDLFDELLKN